MNKILAIVGSGNFGQLIAYHALNDSNYTKIVYFDDYKEIGSIIDGHEVIGKLSEIESYYKQKKFSEIIISLAYKHLNFKKELSEFLQKKNIPLANVIHSSCYIDKSCRIGKGIFMLPGSTLDYNVKIGDNTILANTCAIAHDTEIGEYCFLSARVAIAGFTKIEALCILGINCTIIDNLNICSQTQVGAGAVVTKNITEPGIYVGIPAKKIKNLIL